MTNDFLDRLLKNSQVFKLTTLETIGIKQVALFEVKDRLGLSSRQLRNVIKALNEDISDINKKIKLCIVIEDEFLMFNCQIGYYEYSEIYHSLVCMYLRDSGIFQVLMFIFENRLFSVIKISNELSYSESYVYKILSNIKKYFLEKGWDVYITKKNETYLELTGSESSIRILHYIYLSLASGERAWLLKNISKKEIETMQSYLKSERYGRLSPNEKNKINLIIGIFELSLKNGCFVSMVDNEVRELGDFINRERVIKLYYRYLNDEINGNKQWLKDELVYLGFILSYFSEELRTLSDKERIGGYLNMLDKNEIVTCCKNLLKDISEKYSFQKKTYNYILYSLTNRLVVVHYLKMYQFMPEHSINNINNEIETIIDNCIEKNLKKFKKSPSFIKLKSDFLDIIIRGICDKENEVKKIYIELSNHPGTITALKKILKQIFNRNSLIVVDSFSDAEIVISDAVGYDDKIFFYVENSLDSQTIEKIVGFLSGVIMESDNNLQDIIQNMSKLT